MVVCVCHSIRKQTQPPFSKATLRKLVCLGPGKNFTSSKIETLRTQVVGTTPYRRHNQGILLSNTIYLQQTEGHNHHGAYKHSQLTRDFAPLIFSYCESFD